ncbi:hypothetical protein [Burkholderia anthina]|uniref:hypothetical protein n=1 Tax=Burkholderia anthina TaxID=179879 RepID=UPI001FC8815B|nr:hypothetical protein [Burkholderia anthina]
MELDDLRNSINLIQRSCNNALLRLDSLDRETAGMTSRLDTKAEFSEKFVTALAVQVARRVVDLMGPTIPIGVALWDIETIAAYLRRSPNLVRNRIVKIHSFPHSIRLPTSSSGGKAHRLWRAKDVILWAEEHVET